MKSYVPILILLFALTGCGVTSPLSGPPRSAPNVAVLAPGTDTPRPMARPVADEVLGTGAARSADALDRTTDAERTAALAAPASGVSALGETLAALGSPTEQGFWLRTGLVTNVRSGRVSVAGGGSVAVELRPSGQPPGAGSQLSLAAFRALDLPLTQLVTLQVATE